MNKTESLKTKFQKGFEFVAFGLLFLGGSGLFLFISQVTPSLYSESGKEAVFFTFIVILGTLGLGTILGLVNHYVVNKKATTLSIECEDES